MVDTERTGFGVRYLGGHGELAYPNWNVAALIADTRCVLERYRYNAYGERDVQTSTFASRP